MLPVKSVFINVRGSSKTYYYLLILFSSKSQEMNVYQTLFKKVNLESFGYRAFDCNIEPKLTRQDSF